jgi:hypothetical protein
MTRPSKKKSGQVSGEGGSNQTLDTLLALDRMVMDFSMRTYNIPRRDRLILREQNRRLHDAVRMHLQRS